MMANEMQYILHLGDLHFTTFTNITNYPSSVTNWTLPKTVHEWIKIFNIQYICLQKNSLYTRQVL